MSNTEENNNHETDDNNNNNHNNEISLKSEETKSHKSKRNVKVELIAQAEFVSANYIAHAIKLICDTILGYIKFIIIPNGIIISQYHQSGDLAVMLTIPADDCRYVFKGESDSKKKSFIELCLSSSVLSEKLKEVQNNHTLFLNFMKKMDCSNSAYYLDIVIRKQDSERTFRIDSVNTTIPQFTLKTDINKISPDMVRKNSDLMPDLISLKKSKANIVIGIADEFIVFNPYNKRESQYSRPALIIGENYDPNKVIYSITIIPPMLDAICGMKRLSPLESGTVRIYHYESLSSDSASKKCISFETCICGTSILKFILFDVKDPEKTKESWNNKSKDKKSDKTTIFDDKFDFNLSEKDKGKNDNNSDSEEENKKKKKKKNKRKSEKSNGKHKSSKKSSDKKSSSSSKKKNDDDKLINGSIEISNNGSIDGSEQSADESNSD